MEIINILLNIILFIVIGQLSTISHEFGHAIPALIFTRDNVKIVLGRDKVKTKIISIKRLNIELRGFSPPTGFAYWNSNKVKKSQEMIVYLGGPMVSLIIGIILILLSRITKYYLVNQIIKFSASYHFIQFIITFVPMVYPKWWGDYGGHTSDGQRIVNLFKNI